MRLKTYLFSTKYGAEIFFINGIRPQFKKTLAAITIIKSCQGIFKIIMKSYLSVKLALKILLLQKNLTRLHQGKFKISPQAYHFDNS